LKKKGKRIFVCKTMLKREHSSLPGLKVCAVKNQMNQFRFLSNVMFSFFVLGVSCAFASETGYSDPYRSLASALAIGIVGFGGAMAQAKATAAALEGIGRNPAASAKFFVPMVIGLALIESLVLYAFVIAFRLGSS
jgi:F-type H+-transporting ATPase subunit c